MTDNALQIEGLTARLGQLEILKGIDLVVPFGEIHALMGPNGSGKTTTMRVMTTLRADYYDRPLLHNQLGELMRTRTETVLPLTPAELEEAIGQGTADPNAHIQDLSLGTYWYGAPLDKKALLGKVVLVEIWGS